MRSSRLKQAFSWAAAFVFSRGETPQCLTEVFLVQALHPCRCSRLENMRSGGAVPWYEGFAVLVEVQGGFRLVPGQGQADGLTLKLKWLVVCKFPPTMKIIEVQIQVGCILFSRHRILWPIRQGARTLPSDGGQQAKVIGGVHMKQAFQSISHIATFRKLIRNEGRHDFIAVYLAIQRQGYGNRA